MLVCRCVEPVTRYVRRRERRDGETLLAKLFASLVGLCLMRVVRESELDGVFEYDRGALAKMVEQRRGRTECGRERIGARDGAPLAQPLDERGVRLELVFLVARHVPTQR